MGFEWGGDVPAAAPEKKKGPRQSLKEMIDANPEMQRQLRERADAERKENAQARNEAEDALKNL